MFRGRDKFNKYRKAIKLLEKAISIFPLKIRIGLFEYFRSTKGTKGLAFRYVFLKTIAKECGDNVSIHPDVYLLNPQNISLGSNVSIHPMCYIDAYGEVDIGSDVSIAHAVTIMSTEHYYSNTEIPIKDQGGYASKTIIKDNIWIGSKATILAGNTIGTGSIVAASAVVCKDVSDMTLVAGIPAKVIKNR